MLVTVAISTANGSAPDFIGWLASGTPLGAPTKTLIRLQVVDPAISTIEIVGTNFTYDAGNDEFTAGTITGFNFKQGAATVATAKGFSLPADDLYQAIVNGDDSLINDLIFTSNSFNYTGGAGGDTFTGGDLNDTLNGAAGGDTLSGGDGDDVIQGGAGADVLDGGDGNDTASYAQSAKGVTISLSSETQPIQFAANDATGDVLMNFENVLGSAQADVLTGDDNDNKLSGGAGGDMLLGGDGNDTLIGGAGADNMDGGDGISDTVSYAGSTAAVTVAIALGGGQSVGIGGDAAGDKILNVENVTGGDGADVLTGNELDNVLGGGKGDDVLTGGIGSDTLDGGLGNDTASYKDDAVGVTVDLNLQDGITAQSSAGSEADGDILISIERVVGGSGNDVLTGDGNANKLDGGAGDDVIDGGAGNDTLIGGLGADTVTYASAAVGVTVNLSLIVAQNTGGSGSDTLSGFEGLVGSDFNDVLTGSSSSKTANGIDTISGGLGDDLIRGLSGADVLDGGDGSDTVSYDTSLKGVSVDLTKQDGSTPQDGIAGSSDAAGDVLTNFENAIGSKLADLLTGDTNDNVLTGGLGNDTLIGDDGNDTLIGGGGADTLDGGDGVADTVSYVGSAAAVSVTLGAAGSETLGAGGDAAGDHLKNFENIVGGNGADLLVGNEQDNVLSGGAGNDTLIGGFGVDVLDGGDGTDTASYLSDALGVTVDLRLPTQSSAGSQADGDSLPFVENILGGSGDDVLTGDNGANRLDGGAGDDIVDGGIGNDVLIGGANTSVGDRLSYAGVSADVTVNLAVLTAQNTGGGGSDTVSGFENLTGGDFNDVLTGSTGINAIIGGFGDDVIQGGGGADSLDGGDGNDTVSYALAGKAVTVDFAQQDGSTPQAGTAGASDAAGDVLANFENIIGSKFADKLTGDANDNTLTGGGGADTLDGGGGINTVSYAGAATAVTVALGDLGVQTVGSGGDAAGDLLLNFENVTGGNNNDKLTGNGDDNTLAGGLGNDTLIGGLGSDTLDGGGGSDTASYQGSTNNLTVDLNLQDGMSAQASQPGDEADGDIFLSIENLTGGDGNDTLMGDAAVNRIDGGAGDDTIDGGAGNDILIGGAGIDTFVLRPGSGIDTITGFEHGKDHVDLSAFNLSGVSIVKNTVNLGGGDKLIFTGVTGGALSASDFGLVDSNNPTARDDLVQSTEDASTVTIQASTLTKNDSDPAGGGLTITGIDDTGTHGTVSLVGGNIEFTPDADFSGQTTFTYTVTDSNTDESTATVTVNVAPVADQPVFEIGAPGGDPTPVALTGEIQVNTDGARIYNSASSVLPLGAGGFAVLWDHTVFWTNSTQVQTGYVMEERFDASGNALDPQNIQVANGFAPTTTPLLYGGFAATWLSGSIPYLTPSGPSTSVSGPTNAVEINLVGRGLAFDANGDSIGTPFPTQPNANTHIGALASGGFVGAVTQFSAGNVAWIFDDAGNKAPGYTAFGWPGRIEFAGASVQQSVSMNDVEGLANGGFVAVWTSMFLSTTSSETLLAQRFDSKGGLVGSTLAVESETKLTSAQVHAIDAHVSAFADNSFDVDFYDVGSHAWKAQHYAANGAAVGSATTLVMDAEHSIEWLPNGNFIVFSHQGGSSGELDGQYYRYNSSGAAAIGDVFEVSAGAAGFSTHVDSASILTTGELVISWTRSTLDGQSKDDPTKAHDVFVKEFALPGSQSGGQNAGIELPLIDAEVTDTDGSETMAVVLGNFPAGTTFTLNGNPVGAFDPVTGKWVISNQADIADLNTDHLTLVPPDGYSGAFTLDVQVVVTDTANGTITDQETVLKHIDVAVNPSGGNGLDITSDGGAATTSITLSENVPIVTMVHAVDFDGNPVTYSITGGADAGLFDIDATTGVLSFTAAPDFENPAHANNKYDVMVEAADGTFNDTQAITITVTNVNEAPAIDSNGGDDTAAISVNENTTAIGAVHAIDPEGAAIKYSIAGGDDAAKFKIDAATGALSFAAAPNFEAPTDLNKDNAYVVKVQAATADTLFDTQTITITVQNVDEFAPAISSNGGGASAAISVAENSTAVTTVKATDADHDTVIYSITDGADKTLFTIDSNSGVLAFQTAPDFETPGDAGADNIYNVTVTATAGGKTDTQDLAVKVSNVNEVLTIDSNGGGDTASASVNSGVTAVTTVHATDPDAGSKIAYSISGGADASFFAINATTGALSFKSAPNAANPLDSGKDNSYSVQVKASDGTLSDTQAITVNITGANHAPTIDVSNGTAVPLTLNNAGAGDLVNIADTRYSAGGGNGAQRGHDLVYSADTDQVYLAYNDSETQTGSDHASVVAFDSDLHPSWVWVSSTPASGNFFGIAVDSTGAVYGVGDSYNLTSDGVGGKEVKSLISKVNGDGSPAYDHGQPAFFSYSGVEFFNKDILVNVGGADYIYAAGAGQPKSYDAYLLAKYDTAGNLVGAATDSSVGINLPNGYGAPTPGSSIANNLVADSSDNIWVVGHTQWGTEGDSLAKPVVWEYDSDLHLIGRFKDTQETGFAGAYMAAAIDDAAHALYAVGYTTANGGENPNTYDYLVSKFDTSTGQMLWTHHFGANASEMLNDVVVVNGRVFAVGEFANGVDGLDAVLMEIDPAGGSVITTKALQSNETGDQFARAIATDGSNLYVGGETDAPGGTGIDSFLEKYSLGSGSATQGFHFALPSGALADVDAVGTDILQLSLTVNEGTLTPVGSAPAGLITSGDPEIDLDGSDGSLVLKGTLAALNQAVFQGIDYVMNSGFNTDTLTITLNDRNGLPQGSDFDPATPLSTTVVLNITPNGLDFSPNDIQLSNNTVAENSKAGTVVGLLGASDPDAGDTFTFSLLPGGDAALFQIVGNQLQVKGALNFETKPVDNITIEVKDSAGAAFQKAFQIQVTDVPEGAAETVNGTTSDDYVTSSADNNLDTSQFWNIITKATDGSEIVNGLAGNDFIKGWGGDDQLNGGPGNDRLDGGAGNDALNGGPVLFDGISAAGWADINTAIYSDATGGVTADLKAGTAGGAGVGNDTLVNIEGVVGSQFDDTLSGGTAAFFETFQGGAGNDVIDGRGGLDKAVYSDASAGIAVHMASGAVDGATGGVGTDSLHSVEWVVGSKFGDTYDATGFSALSANQGNFVDGSANFFAPGAGDDTVTGNGETILDYSDMKNAITVDLGKLTATGTGTEIGSDTFTGVMGVVGGAASDALTGSDNFNSDPDSGSPNFELFFGGGGNDVIDGEKGLDFAVYDFFAGAITAGVSIDLAAGKVTGLDANTQALVGTDTLRNIEGAWGTVLNDTYNAKNYMQSGFTDPNKFNVGDGADIFGPGADAANLFDPGAGNDTIVGNNFTVLRYFTATGGITANFSASTVGSGSITGNASVGTDTFSGVFEVHGTHFSDRLVGGAGTQSLEGGGGDDILIGGAGNDQLANGAVDYSGATAAVTVDLSQGHATGDASVGNDSLQDIRGVVGSKFGDMLIGGGNQNRETFRGGAGNDTIMGAHNNGGAGSTFELSDYSDATGSVTAVLSNSGGTLHGTAAGTGIGNDTLTDINMIRGSNFADTYDATGISILNNGQDFNQFEGGGGNDIIKGNGNTWASYEHASAGVVVNLDSTSHNFTYAGGAFSKIDAGGATTVAAATATSVGASDSAKIGTDTFQYVPSVPTQLGVTVAIGSSFDDILFGSLGSGQTFNPGLGNDYIDGRGGGQDWVDYSSSMLNSLTDQSDFGLDNGNVQINETTEVPWGGLHGMTINLAAGVIVGDPLITGTDTIRNIDKVSGTFLDDIYNATGFGLAGAVNVVTSPLSVAANWNEFIGAGGNDTIIGNGNTTISYEISSTSVSVDLLVGTADGVASGHDSIVGGVNAVIGSVRDDVFRGTAANESFDGNGGADAILYDMATGPVTVNLVDGVNGTATGTGVGTDHLSAIETVVGSAGNDKLTGSNSNASFYTETFYGGEGDDTIDGNGGFDRAVYNPLYFDALGPADDLTGAHGISIDLGAGTVTGVDATALAAVGTDTLRSIDSVYGTNADDTFDASTFSTASVNVSDSSQDSFNEFQGFGGDDVIIANGATRVSYAGADAAVAVNLSSAAYNYTGGAGSVAAHTGQSFDGAGNDSAHVGTDTFTVSGADQVEWVWGSAFDDILVGRTTNGQTPEVFTGGAGDDFFDGNGGFDRAVYYYDETGGSGITVHLATGTVDSADEVTAANIGTDTLRSIDSVMGTNANDIYDATGFDASAVNLPDFFNSASPTPQGFNEFIGSGGDDTITGNGNTRAGYEFANGAVTVNLANGSGTADGDGSTGHDTFTGGVQAVIGSSFGDTIVGGGGGQRIQGFYGADNLTGGGGADQFEYGSAAEGLDTISDFTSGTDRFRIREAGFGIDDNTHTTANAFGGFTLNAGEFVTGTAATQANGQFIFDSTTNPSDHMLYWDADGTGAAAKVLIAHLGSATVAMSDFDLR